MKIEEDQITESVHDTEPEIESTQTEILSTSNVEMESDTQINEALSKHDTELETSHTNLKQGIETIQIKPTEIETGLPTESPTNTELTIEMSQNDTQSYWNDNEGIDLDTSQAEKNQTEIEPNTPSENINNKQENTQTAEDNEMTGELKGGDEPINAKENTQMEESIVMSGEILQHENGSINSEENTKIENIDLSGETQYGNESINSKEITKTDKINEMTGDPQNGDEASNENIQTKENTEVSWGIEHADDSKNAQNNAELNVQDKEIQYNPTHHSGLDNSDRKLKFKIQNTSQTNRDAYNKKLLYRPMFTAITNAMGEMCPFYVCSKNVKLVTDLNKLEVTTETKDQSYRDLTERDVSFNEKYPYLRRSWRNEIENNSKFEHNRHVAAADTKVHLYQRRDQMNESEEFPPYSDDNDGNTNSHKLQVQSNEEDEFESYSDDT